MAAISKIVVVTGANSGIGYEIVKKMLQSTKAKYHVFVGARTIEKAQDASDKLKSEVSNSSSTAEPLVVDLNSDESIGKAAAQVEAKFGRLDALVNNAGASYDPAYTKGEMTLRECFTKAYDTNVSGTNVLTHALMPLLLKSADPRLLFVSGLSGIVAASETYFPTPPQPAGWPKPAPSSGSFETIGYRCTKVALNMLMLDWNHKLQADGVKVWGIMPGMLATNLGALGPEMMEEVVKKFGIGHPSLGGELVTSVVEGERDADVGKLVSRDGLRGW